MEWPYEMNLLKSYQYNTGLILEERPIKKKDK
jgi:hypothetical protein